MEKCEKMMKNIGNEELGKINPTQSQKPGCFARRKEEKEEEKKPKKIYPGRVLRT